MADKAKITAILAADPYAEKSFSRNGYKVKEGPQVGLDREKLYLYLKCPDEFVSFAKEKLSGLASEAAPEKSKAVIAKIEEEESSAEVGFGSIFGE